MISASTFQCFHKTQFVSIRMEATLRDGILTPATPWSISTYLPQLLGICGLESESILKDVETAWYIRVNGHRLYRLVVALIRRPFYPN